MSERETKPAAAKKSSRKRTKAPTRKAAKRAKTAKKAVKAIKKVAIKPPTQAASAVPAKPARTAGEPDIAQTLEEIKKRFMEKCPRCSSAMKNTFINLGANQRLLVNQCKVCKFYLPA